VKVEIYALELLGLDGDIVHFAVECSGGTYVRSLAHDIGQKIRCPAHLASLRRTAVAEFNESRAVTLDQLRSMTEAGTVGNAIVPLEALLPDCPELVVRGREEQGVRHGHKFELAQALRPDRGSRPNHSPVITILKIMNPERRLIAVARHVQGSVYHPDLVLV
jgi:tRNA pseudouridine55 synthase